MRRVSTVMGLCVMNLGASAVVLALSLAPGCARDPEGIAILTSGPLPRGAGQPTRLDAAATRLADEICKRKASCVASGPGGSSWTWASTPDCVAREAPRLRAELASWDCSEVSAEARFEQCLPAVKTATCEPLLANDARLPLCPTTATCSDRTAGDDAPREPEPAVLP